MSLKIANLQFAASLGGLANYETDSFNFPVNGHSLAANQVSKWSTTWPINNSNAISSVLLQYTLDSVWRYTGGAISLVYNSGAYQVETVNYYSGSNLVVETYVINQAAGTTVIPQFSVNIRVSLFNAPF